MRIQPHQIEHQSGQLCPSCCSTDVIRKKGILEVRKGRYGGFLSCSRYPDCKYSCKVSKNLENQATDLLKKKCKKTRRGKKKKPAHVLVNKRLREKELKKYKSQRKERWEQYQEFRRLIS